MPNNKILLILGLLCISFVSAETLQEYYLPNTADTSVTFAVQNGDTYCQAWNPQTDYNVTTITWLLKQQNGADANAWDHVIYNTTGSGTRDTELYRYGYEDGVNLSLTNALAYYNFTVNVFEAVTTQEYLTCMYSTASSGNGLHLGSNASNPFPYGGIVRNTPPTDTVYYAGRDLEFAIWSQDVGGGGGPTGGTPTLLWSFTNNSNFNAADVPFTFNFSTYCNNDCVGTFNITVTRTNRTGNFAQQVTQQTYKNINLNLSEAWLHPKWVYYWDDFEGQLNWTIDIVPNNAADTGVNQTYFLYVDTILPGVNSIGDLNNETNKVFYRNVDPDVLNFTLEFSDTNLYYYNHTIEYWGVNGSAYNLTINNTEAYNTSSVNISSLFINIQGLPNGVYKQIGTAKDAHTALNISAMDWTFNPDGSLYIEGVTFEPGFKQYTAGGDLATYFYYAGDRYKLKVTFEDTATQHTFIIHAPGWRYVGDRYGYKGHFVNVFTDRWLDFEGNNINAVDVVALGNDRYEITTYLDVANDEVEYESIGIINTKTTIWTFNITNGYTFSAINPAFDTIYNFSISIYNSTSLIQNKTANGQNVTFNITSGSYYTNITHPDYLTNSTDLLTFTPGGSFEYLLFAPDTFYLLFYDEITEILINGTYISLDLISDSFSANYSTTDGSITIQVPTPEDYTFRYQATGYNPRVSSYSLANNSYSDINLYLLLSGANVSIFVYNQAAQVVEGAEIRIYRYNVASNSYILVNTVTTDFTGSAISDMSINSEFYKFFIYYNGVLKKQTAGAYVTATELTFEINTETATGKDYYTIQDVTGGVAFNEATGNFRFYYSDPANSISQGCLYLYKVSFSGETLFNSSCVNSPSSLILLNAPNISGQTYAASGYITIEGQDYLYDSASYTYKPDTEYGQIGIFIVIMLTLLFALIMIWDISIGLILIPIPLILGSSTVLNWVDVSPEAALGLEVIMFVLAFLIRRGRY